MKKLAKGGLQPEVEKRYREIMAQQPVRRKTSLSFAATEALKRETAAAAEQGGERGAKRGARAAIEPIKKMVKKLHDHLLGSGATGSGA